MLPASFKLVLNVKEHRKLVLQKPDNSSSEQSTRQQQWLLGWENADPFQSNSKAYKSVLAVMQLSHTATNPG